MKRSDLSQAEEPMGAPVQVRVVRRHKILVVDQDISELLETVRTVLRVNDSSGEEIIPLSGPQIQPSAVGLKPNFS
jgi:hypothetical protein